MPLWKLTVAEIFKELVPSLNIILGALMALVGARYQSWVNNRAEKARLKCEKLERAYKLCQAIYDGHRKEVNNAKQHIASSPKKFIENRKHPGTEMSELKMLIRCYIPSLTTSLVEIDKGHAPLKKDLREIEDIALQNKALTAAELKTKLAIWENHLKSLSHGSNIIKAGLEKELRKLAGGA